MEAATVIEQGLDMDKLSHEIFSILESKFLFGYDDPKLLVSGATPATKAPVGTPGRVRILSIDAGGSTDGLLAAISLSRLESYIRKKSGNPAAHISDFFDVAAGSGAGGVLAALLFTRGPDGLPLFSSGEALQFLAKNHRRIQRTGNKGKGIFQGIFGKSESGSSSKFFRAIFRDATLRDTVKPVLVTCYDLSTGAPFVFSRADAMETDGYDFLMGDVCAATMGSAEMRSVDGRTGVASVEGGVATANPMAAAITHVLNNKMEFPFAGGVEDLLVVSLGNGEASGVGGRRSLSESPSSASQIVRIAGESVTDMVDQAVSMAFGHNRTSSYVRIQGNGFNSGKVHGNKEGKHVLRIAEGMLGQKNVESVLFRGKKLSEKTNEEKLEWVSGELIKEQERRKTSVFPVVMLKQASPRSSSSSATTTSSSSPAH